ncbi:MAG: hypothetical protein ChlgKO_13580 [Chlamydiales bacterium]
MKSKGFLLVSCWLGFVLVAQFLKFNIPMGEQFASLSCLAVALPLLAAFMPAKKSLPIIGAVWMMLHLFHPIPLTMGIPTLLASLSWRYSEKKEGANWLMHLALPIVAMALFVLAPAGKIAWSYALYWLIPMVLCFVRTSVWSRAVQSTFVAHAAGSVIWAYAVPMSGAQWIGLIPVVAVERLLAASLAVVLVQVLSSVSARREVMADNLAPITI